MKNITYYFLFSTLIISIFPLLASSQNLTDIKQDNNSSFFSNILNHIDTSVRIEEELMIETDEGNTQKFETLIHPEIEVSFPLDIDFKAIGRFRYDAVDNLEHGDSSQSEISAVSRRAIVGDRIEFELREFYFEKNIGKAYLKLGKQQIVWGNADGLKVLDVVNPQDFREFIYDDWEDSRIPLWTINAEIPINDWLMQLIWIPDRTYHKIPEPDSTFEFTSPMIVGNPPAGVNINQHSVDRPQRFLSDSDVGVRFSRFWKGWDFTLNYLYHYDDIPVAFSDVSISNGKPLITVSPEYKRSHLVGGTFSNAFGNLVIRGEFGYFFNRYFVVDDLDNSDGVVETDEFSYVSGFDWSGFSDTLLSLQFFQGIITDSPSGLIRDRIESNVSLYVSREFMNNVLHTEFIWLQNLNHSDGFFQPGISYELKDNIKLKLGIDLFYGTDKGLFGQFNDKDRIGLGIEVGL